MKKWLLVILGLTVVTMMPAGDMLASVDIEAFTAQGRTDHILISWDTGQELDNAGFHLWRGSSNVQSNATRITNGVIPPLNPGQTLGGHYEYEDSTVSSNIIYFYWLEDIDINGNSSFTGPVSANLTGGGVIVATNTPLPTHTPQPIPTETAMPTVSIITSSATATRSVVSPSPTSTSTPAPSATSTLPASITPDSVTPTRQPTATPMPTNPLPPTVTPFLVQSPVPTEQTNPPASPTPTATSSLAQLPTLAPTDLPVVQPTTDEMIAGNAENGNGDGNEVIASQTNAEPTATVAPPLVSPVSTQVASAGNTVSDSQSVIGETINPQTSDIVGAGAGEVDNSSSSEGEGFNKMWLLLGSALLVIFAGTAGIITFVLRQRQEQ